MSLNSNLKDEFNENTLLYLRWLKQNQVKISPKITIYDYTSINQGRGVIALQDIKNGEILAKIPKNILINLKQNLIIENFPCLKQKIIRLNHWDSLIIILSYEIRHKDKSKWKDYLKILPSCKSDFNQLMFWDSNELNMLQPSYILERIGKDSAKKMFEQIKKIIEELKITELQDLTFDEYNIIATLIMSYSFDVELTDDEENQLINEQLKTDSQEDKLAHENHNTNEIQEIEDDETKEEISILLDGNLKSMVPLADTLNADTNYNNAVVIHESDYLVVTSIKDIKQGEQIYNTYSNHPNSEILRRYGYVEPEGSKFDFGDIPLSIIQQFFLEKYNVSEDDLNLLFEILGEISYEERIEEDEDTNEGVELIIDSYDCFKSGEVIIELIFLVQFLTTFLKSNQQIKISPVKRTYLKIYQLISSKKVTTEFLKNFKEILEIRLDQYPIYASEPFDKILKIWNRDEMSEIVLKSEYHALKNCKDGGISTIGKTLDSKVKLIDDDKLIRAILKKRTTTENEGDIQDGEEHKNGTHKEENNNKKQKL
ncbi:RKM4 [Candida jiufengensis]|uniref:RKM4 n=1 Tax=Candida jiufengensis TaxID=497108 RepID=UPI002224D98B|nr:RKM4 [Candida jiufengensis]KAI5956444.1 RKM4 [Candida jiufengensis]